jgi:hypothetical protein
MRRDAVDDALPSLVTDLSDEFRRSLTRLVAHSILRSHTILNMTGERRG